MENITSIDTLKEAIYLLEIKQAEQGKVIKEHFNIIRENLRPANLIKNTFSEAVNSPHLVTNMLGTLLGMGAGYLSRKILIGSSGNIIRKIFGGILQLGITAVVAKKPDVLQAIGKNAVKHVFTKKDSYEPSRN